MRRGFHHQPTPPLTFRLRHAAAGEDSAESWGRAELPLTARCPDQGRVRAPRGVGQVVNSSECWILMC